MAVINIIVTIVCLAIALIPEGIMYLLWHLVVPTNFLEHFLVIALFVIFGGGFCVGFAVVAFFLWVLILKAVN